MICRMNKAQRKALNELIDAKVTDAIDRNADSIFRVLEAEVAFEEAFKNEAEHEENFDHVKGT